MNKIPTICYEDIYEFCEDVDSEFEKYLDKAIEKDGTVDIPILAKYKNAREIINILVDFGYEIANVSIHDSIMNGYADEYIVSLCYGLNHSDVPEIWCQPAKDDKGYYLNQGDAIYILDECNSKVISQIESDRTYIVELEDEIEDEYDDFVDDLECGNCEECYMYNDSDDEENEKDDEYVTIELTPEEAAIWDMLYHSFSLIKYLI